MDRLEDLDLNLLLLLDWLLKERSVTRAAKRLGTTQPAASRNLQKLRRIFGDELLVRSGRSYILTKRATDIQSDLSNAISSLRFATRKSTPFEPENAEGMMTISSPDYLALIGIHAWKSSVLERAPAITANWRPLEPSVLKALVSGEVDFIMAPYAAMPNIPTTTLTQDMVIKPLFKDEWVLFAGADHALMQAETLTVQAYAEADHVLVSPQGEGQGLMDRHLAAQGLTRRISHRAWSFGLAAEIALATHSVVVLPRALASLFPSGQMRSLPITVDPMPSFLAWHNSRSRDPIHQWVRDRMMKGFSGLASPENS